MDRLTCRASASAVLVSALLAGIPAQPASARIERPRTAVFDAVFGAKSGFKDVAPTGDSIGDQQFASGPLRDRRGKTLGRFSFTCTWVSVQGDVVHEHCSGDAVLRGGHLRTRGPALRSDASHDWVLAGGTGLYRNARGRVVVHDLGTTESFVVVRFTAGAPRRLPGEVARPAANAAFIRRAEAVCATARTALAALPGFPLDTFDPAHPTIDQLHAVGAYFTGPGDPRPTFRSEISALTALGAPPALHAAWTDVLAGRAAVLPDIETQDTAATAGDIPGFVASLQAIANDIRRETLAVAVFGALGCYPA
jgi:hypothetical protein